MIPEDVIAEGNLGLVFAARKFDRARGVKFATYAAPWIRAVLMSQMLHNGPVHYLTTSRLRYGFYRFRKAWSALLHEGKEPTVSLLAKKIGIDEKTAETLYTRLVPRDFPLDAYHDDGGTFELGTDEGNPENLFGNEERQEVFRGELLDALDQLDHRLAHIVRRRYLTDPAWTLQELGTEVGLSRERIRQLEEQAFQKLRQILPRKIKFQLAID
jgi:RNA polymerase sigma-32 factor